MSPPRSATPRTLSSLPDPMERDPKKCAGTSKRSGLPCKNDPMRGGTVCHMHGGKAPQTRAAAKRRVERQEAEKAIAREIEKLGESISIHPLDAILEMVHEAAANLHVLRALVADDKNTRAVYDEKGRPYTHPVLAFYNEERDRLARISKMALDAGIDERRVRMQEARGREMAEVVREAIDAMSPTPAQREAGYQAAAEAMRRRTAA